jgi:broad specificity phosphatase PhoE
MASTETTLFLVRHGDRWDFANRDKWQSAATTHGFEARDPPLSGLGHEQARSTGIELAAQGVDVILSSPYLRAIQTAQPLADSCELSICIEEGLAEVQHVIGSIPTPVQRFPYFPQVDLAYEPMLTIQPTAFGADGRSCERFPLDYLRRMLRLAPLLSQRYRGKRVACVSHAASVALVAALTGMSLNDVGRFAPCGIFKLVSADGCSWALEQHGGDNSAHVARNNPATAPWGFADCRSLLSEPDQAKVTAEFLDHLWNEAKGESDES